MAALAPTLFLSPKMSDLLFLLAAQIDDQIPNVLFAALTRSFVLHSAQSVTIIPYKNDILLYFSRFVSTVSIFCSFVFYVFLFYVSLDVYQNLDIVHTCGAHTTPRPIAISVSVALLCFTFTKRFSVSCLSLITFVCVKELNVLSGVAALTTFASYMNMRCFGILLIFSMIIGTIHGTKCSFSSSALLSISSFTFLSFKFIFLSLKYFTRNCKRVALKCLNWC